MYRKCLVVSLNDSVHTYGIAGVVAVCGVRSVIVLECGIRIGANHFFKAWE